MEQEWMPMGFVRYAGTVVLTERPNYFSMAYDCRLFLILGEGSIRIDTRDYRLAVGDVVYIPPAIPYRFCPKEAMEIRAVNFDIGEDVRRDISLLPPVAADRFDWGLVSVIPPVSFREPLVLGPSSRIARLIEDIAQEKRFPMEGSEEMLSLLIRQCMLLLHRGCLRPVSRKEEALVREILRYMEEHLAESFDGGALAERLCYHPYYINRVFKKATGETMHACLLRMRVERAASLLQTTDLPIDQVGASVGFGNHAHFSKVFRRYIGMTPGEYRRSHPVV